MVIRVETYESPLMPLFSVKKEILIGEQNIFLVKKRSGFSIDVWLSCIDFGHCVSGNSFLIETARNQHGS